MAGEYLSTDPNAGSDASGQYLSTDPNAGAPAARAKPAAAAESPTSAKNLLGAAVEPAVSMASGMVAAPVAGLSGLAVAIANGMGLTDKKGGDTVREVGSKMTYEPKTTGGKNALKVIAAPFEALSEGADWAGGKATDIGTSIGLPPEAAAANGAYVNTGIQALAQIIVGKGLSKAAPVAGKPNANPDVRMLSEKGVTLTPGEALGGSWSKNEQRLSSVPFVGDVVKNARGKGVEQFSVAAINDSLAPIGEKLPPGLKGNAAIERAYEILGDKYESLLPNMKGHLDALPEKLPGAASIVDEYTQMMAGKSGGQLAPPPKATLRNELDIIKENANDLPPQQAKDLQRIVDKEIIAKFEKDGTIDGKGLKAIQEKLRLEAARFRGGDAYQRALSEAIDDASSAVRQMVRDVNPEAAAELKKIDTGYSKFKIAQKAAASTAADKGTFTPSQYNTAVKAGDKSKDKARFAEGNANQQPLAQAGKSVLSDTVPDSGTAQRLMFMDLLLGGGGHAALGPAGIAAGLSLPMLYSQPVLRAMQPMLMRPPNVGHAALRAYAPGAMQQGQLSPPPQR